MKKYASLNEAIVAHYADTPPTGPPDWWTPEVEAKVQRYATDAAFRESLPASETARLNTLREGAIQHGLITA